MQWVCSHCRNKLTGCVSFLICAKVTWTWARIQNFCDSMCVLTTASSSSSSYILLTLPLPSIRWICSARTRAVAERMEREGEKDKSGKGNKGQGLRIGGPGNRCLKSGYMGEQRGRQEGEQMREWPCWQSSNTVWWRGEGVSERRRWPDGQRGKQARGANLVGQRGSWVGEGATRLGEWWDGQAIEWVRRCWLFKKKI